MTFGNKQFELGKKNATGPNNVQRASSADADGGQHGTLSVLAALVVAPLLGVVFHSIDRHSLSIFGVALVLAWGAFSLGGVLGFLFGIPRTSEAAATRGVELQHLPNTNLEQISDWLTKVLIGVGWSS